MLIRDGFRQQFYEIVRKDHVLLLVHNDVDALCASHILMSMFSCDDVAFSLLVITGWESLKRSLEERLESPSSTAVLINCGANRSLITLNLPPNMNLFIIDSRRPFELDNVFAERNIRILVKGAELEGMNGPKAADIYPSDSDDSDDDDDGDEETTGLGRRTIEQIERRALKRERKRQWQKRRADILWEYYENSWYSTSSAVLMLELSHELGKASSSLMWSAVVGLNSQLVDNLISLDAYTGVCIDTLRPFVRRYAPRDPTSLKGDDILRISFDKELLLPLYAHWSLYSSMEHSDHFACITQAWQQRGDSRMKSLFTSLGLTLTECKQMFSALSSERRREVFNIIEKKMNLNYASFTAVVGFCNRFNAGDFARALCARLEVGVGEKETDFERFTAAIEILRNFINGGGQFSLVLKNMELYKSFLGSAVSQVFTAVTQDHVIAVGPFFLLTPPKNSDARLFTSRHFLFLYASFVHKAFCATSRLRNRHLRPLIVAVPMLEEDDGWCLVTGLMPLHTAYPDSHIKSFIGRVFERVLEKRNTIVRRDSFDPTVLIVKTEEKGRFFEGLQAVLETLS